MSEKQQVDQVSINIFDLIDSICAEFRRQWKAGNRPRIESYLEKVPEAARTTLFRNLLQAEIRSRRQADESPSSDEYVNRFPAFKRLIRQAFDEPTLMSMEAAPSTPDHGDGAQTITIDLPAANRIGDYELLRELGRGGFGVVYEARHTKTGNRVALKTLPTGTDGQQVNAERLHRFRREFRRLSEINHPNLVGMQSLEVDGSQWFFTMDLIEGQDFLTSVRPGDEFDEARLRSCLSQLARGVMELHRRGIIHRDLKPSNVLVTHDGRVTILDFGLAAELQKATDMTQTRSGMFAGTPRYAAPEQMFGERTEASDWYAFGTMLYEALTGAPPFHGKDQVALLRYKQEQDAPALSGRDRIPNDLAELADGLVRREPRERLHADLVAKRLGFDQDTQFSGSTKDSYGSTGSVDEESPEIGGREYDEVVLIGREEQLVQLEAAKEEFVKSRVPSVVWVSGLSGEGKSSLVEKFLRPIRRRNEMLVLFGRCYDRESVPFKAVDVLIEALVSFLRSRPSDQVKAWLPQDTHLLAHLFPAMRRVDTIDEQPKGDKLKIDDRQIRYRAFFALRELLTSISRETPIVAYIDDLQWGDADSSEVLFDLLSPPNSLSVLLLGSYRSDEFEQSPFLQDWTRRSQEQPSLSGQLVSVAPLTEEQCLEFMAQSIGVSPNELREQAHATFADTKGNPYFLEQLIEGFNAETGQFEPVPLNEIVERKLSQLPKDAADLLQVIVIAGKALSIEEASQVAGYDLPRFSTVTHMRNERLVRLIGSEDQQLVDTYHDKIRETVLETLGSTSRRTLHLQFAEHVEAQSGVTAADIFEYLEGPYSSITPAGFPIDRVFDLAYHFFMAEDSRALEYQFMAGELSYQSFASEEAIQYFNRVESLLENENTALRARFWHRLAVSCYRIHDYEASLSQFEQVIQLAASDFDRAVAFAGIGASHQSLNRYELAAKYHDLALTTIDAARPTGFRAYLRATILAIKLALGPLSWWKSTAGDGDQEYLLEQSIYTDIVQYKFDQLAPLIDYPFAVLRLGELSLRSSNANTYASGVSMLAAHLGLSGFPGLGVRLNRQALKMIPQMHDMEKQGVCFYTTGVMLSVTTKLEEAERYFEDAIHLLTKTGSHMHASTSLHMQRHLYEYVGSSSQEIECARRLVAFARSSKDKRGLCWGLYDLAGGLARAGQTESSLDAISESHEIRQACELNLTHPIYFAQRAFVFLQASSHQLAKESASQSWTLAVKHLRIMDVSVRGLPWFLEAAAGPKWTEQATSVDKRMLLQRCRAAWWLTRFYPKLRAHLYRARGRALYALGKSKRGIRSLERAVYSASTLGTDFELARSLLDLAAIKNEGREENRRHAVVLLQKMESVIPRAESWLLGDQYNEAVVAPEFDLESWEREHGSLLDESESIA